MTTERPGPSHGRHRGRHRGVGRDARPAQLVGAQPQGGPHLGVEPAPGVAVDQPVAGPPHAAGAVDQLGDEGPVPLRQPAAGQQAGDDDVGPAAAPRRRSGPPGQAPGSVPDAGPRARPGSTAQALLGTGPGAPQPVGRGHRASPFRLDGQQAQASVAGDHHVAVQPAGRQVAGGPRGRPGPPAPAGGGPARSSRPDPGAPPGAARRRARCQSRNRSSGSIFWAYVAAPALGHWRAQPVGQGADQHGGAQRDQLAPQLGRRLFRPDRHLLAAVDRTGVEALVDGHEADAGDGVAGQDGPLDRGRAPPAGQQREVDVDERQAVEHVRS